MMEIPEGWQKGRVDNFIKLQRGFDLTKKNSVEGSYPVYSSSGISYYHNAFKVEPPGIVTGRKGSVGPVYYITENFWPHDTSLWVSDFKNNLPKYIWYFLQSLKLERFDESSSVPTLNRNNVHRIKVVFPSFYEQKRITEILGTWDRAIAATEALIAQSEAQKKALMQQLLTGKRRLPGFEGEWREVRLGDLGTISSAGVDKKIVEGEQTVRLLNFLDAFRREFIKNEHLTHEVTAPDRKIKKCNVKKGDVFLTPTSETRLDIGLAAVAVEDMPGVCYSYHVVRFRPSEHLQETFSTYALQTDHYKRQAYRLGDGSGQRYVISQDGFRSITILVPEVDEQLAIGKILSDCSVQIQALQAKLKTLKSEKAALMQQLLTGKRRVKLTEAAA